MIITISGNPYRWVSGRWAVLVGLAWLLMACGGSSESSSVSSASSLSSSVSLSSAVSSAVSSASSAPDECALVQAGGDDQPLIQLNPCGTLSYRLYPNRDQSAAVNRVPDFSYAGYAGGGVALPEVPIVQTLNPDPQAGDDRQRIQAALDSIGELPANAQGIRGALLLTQGSYRVSDSLYMRHSGVVLRGAGQGEGGTVIIATRQAPHPLIAIEPGVDAGLRELDGSRQVITDTYVPVGSRAFSVATSAGLAVGDTIAVLRTPNQAWIDAMTMAQWGWTPASYTIAHERVITGIDGDRITVNIPLVDSLLEAHGGGVVYRAQTALLANRLRQVGVEDVRLVAQFTDADAEQHANIGVRLAHTRDSWVQRVSGVHFSYATVSVEQDSHFNTFQEVAYLEPASQVTGSRRYAFNVSAGLGNLFQRCYAESGRHSFVTGGRVTGPNVWLDCVAVRASNDDGPHHRWATGLLFDNIKARRINVQNRTSSGTGHGWAGAQVMIWNSEAAEGFIVDAPQGAMNWIVGGVGARNNGTWAPEEPAGWWESEGETVQPRSLYLQQLQDRLGTAAVLAVTTQAQRDGRIWDLLQGWAGGGLLSQAQPATQVPGECSGIVSGEACCPLACGQCGGTGCGQFPGGASQCCAGNILSSGLSCLDYEPPCVIP